MATKSARQWNMHYPDKKSTFDQPVYCIDCNAWPAPIRTEDGRVCSACNNKRQEEESK